MREALEAVHDRLHDLRHDAVVEGGRVIAVGHRVLELAYEDMNEPELVRIEPDKMTVDAVRRTPRTA